MKWTDVDRDGSSRELNFEFDMHPGPAGESGGVGDIITGHSHGQGRDLLADRMQYSSARSSLDATDSHR